MFWSLNVTFRVFRSLFSPLMSITTSLFGSTYFASEHSSLDLDGIEQDFAALKRNMNNYPYYHERNFIMSFY